MSKYFNFININNCLQVGLATLLPTTLVWGEAYVLMSSHVVAIVCWGLALAELMVPYSMKLLSLDMQSWLGQRLLNRWTSQLDLGSTAGSLERVVSVHNST